MRKIVLPAIALIILALSQARPAVAQRPGLEADSSLTAGRLVERLRSAIDGIVEHAGAELRDPASLAVADLRGLAEQLDTVFRDSLDLPLAGLRGSREEPARRGFTAVLLAEDLVTTLGTCVREEVSALLAAFRENIHRTVGDAGSWSSDGPRILRVESADGEFPYPIRAGAAYALSFAGANLDSDDCGRATASIAGPGDAPPIELEASSRAEGNIDVEIPPLEEAGVYDISVRLRRRRFLFFCRSSSVATSIAVLPAAPFRVHYRVSTTRSVVQEIVWDAGELREANDRCDGPATVSRLFRLPEGWTFESYDWIVFLNSGAVKEKEEVRGNAVYVEYRVTEKGGPLCTGPTSLIHGKMEIRGGRTSTTPGPSLDVTYGRPLAFGESVTIPVRLDPGDDGPPIMAWSIEVRLVYPDGSVHTLPAQTGNGPLSAAEAGGGSFSWDPAGKRLRISAPGQSCRAH